MKSCKKCGSVSTIGLFISVAAVILALIAYFHKIKLTEGMWSNTKWETQRDSNELIYTYDGTEVMKLASNGDITVRGSITVDKDIIVGADVIQKKKPYYLKTKDADVFVRKDKT